jgi:hypothetical protein
VPGTPSTIPPASTPIAAMWRRRPMHIGTSAAPSGGRSRLGSPPPRPHHTTPGHPHVLLSTTLTRAPCCEAARASALAQALCRDGVAGLGLRPLALLSTAAEHSLARPVSRPAHQLSVEYGRLPSRPLSRPATPSA